MRIQETIIPGCYEILPNILKDERGRFVKTFHQDIFTEHGLATRFAEEYYTYSRRGVLRGLHFQIPPRDHVKLVTCVSGAVLDAVVDLRVGSPAYGKHLTFELSAEKANMLYLPAGLAHGFYVQSADALLLYKVTSVYSPAHDAGLLWSSAGISWPDRSPIISVRDGGFPAFAEFKSPFVFSATTPK
jgi:dTDP-4-dehydrorhamnose 3,5-epimerase